MNPVEQAVGATAFFWLQLGGYLVFAAAIVVLALASMKATAELAIELKKFLSWRRRRPSPVSDGADRIARIDDSAGSIALPAMSARVLTFAPRKTRNRVVVR